MVGVNLKIRFRPRADGTLEQDGGGGQRSSVFFSITCLRPTSDPTRPDRVRTHTLHVPACRRDYARRAVQQLHKAQRIGLDTTPAPPSPPSSVTTSLELLF